MKKILTTLALIAMVLSANAQNQVYHYDCAYNQNMYEEVIKLIDNAFLPDGYKIQQNNGNLQEVG